MERFFAAPGVKVGATTVIPIQRLTSAGSACAVVAVMMPVAVVVIRSGRKPPLVQDMAGRTVSLEPWLERLPELSGLIAESVDVAPKGQ